MIDWSKMRTAEQLAEARQLAENSVIEAQLRELDIKSIRALRAVASGVATAQDMDVLRKSEAEAEALRSRVKKP